MTLKGTVVIETDLLGTSPGIYLKDPEATYLQHEEDKPHLLRISGYILTCIHVIQRDNCSMSVELSMHA